MWSIYDYFESLDVNLHEYTIPKELLLSCKQVHSKYEETRQKKKIESIKENERKGKMKEDEVACIKWETFYLWWSVKSMEADVDNYLTLAEENNDISSLVKALLENLFGKTLIKISTRPLENWSAS